MLKRFSISLMLIVGFVAMGIALHSGLAISPVTPAINAAVNHSAVWVMDAGSSMSHWVALDAASGERLLDMQPPFISPAISRGGHKMYLANVMLQGGSESVLITAIDLTRGAVTRIFPLGFSQNSLFNLRPAIVTLAVSDDDSRLAAEVTTQYGRQQYTRVYGGDPVRSGDPAGYYLLPEVGLSISDAYQSQPMTWMEFTRDGKKLVVVEKNDNASPPSTQVSVFRVSDDPTTGLSADGTFDISGALPEAGNDTYWLALDGQRLSVLRTLFDNGENTGYAFAVVDLEQARVLNTRVVNRAEGGILFCNTSAHLTPDARYIYGVCENDFDQPGGTLQFLDTQTGLVANQVAITLNADSTNHWWGMQTMASPDNRLAYVLNPVIGEIVVVDLAQQTIARRGNYQNNHASLNLTRWLEGQFVGTAAAKGGEEGFTARTALSGDGKRLYVGGSQVLYDSQVSFANDGVWAVATDSLKPMGHWLGGKNINDVQLSADGSELYALGANDHTLYVLDAFTGQTLRAFEHVVNQPLGFVTWQ